MYDCGDSRHRAGNPMIDRLSLAIVPQQAVNGVTRSGIGLKPLDSCCWSSCFENGCLSGDGWSSLRRLAETFSRSLLEFIYCGWFIVGARSWSVWSKRWQCADEGRRRLTSKWRRRPCQLCAHTLLGGTQLAEIQNRFRVETALCALSLLHNFFFYQYLKIWRRSTGFSRQIGIFRPHHSLRSEFLVSAALCVIPVSWSFWSR